MQRRTGEQLPLACLSTRVRHLRTISASSARRSSVVILESVYCGGRWLGIGGPGPAPLCLVQQPGPSHLGEPRLPLLVDQQHKAYHFCSPAQFLSACAHCLQRSGRPGSDAATITCSVSWIGPRWRSLAENRVRASKHAGRPAPLFPQLSSSSPCLITLSKTPSAAMEPEVSAPHSPCPAPACSTHQA